MQSRVTCDPPERHHSNMIPALELEGAQLRAWADIDADRLVAAWSDAEIARWNPVPPDPSTETAASWIAGVADRANKRLSFDWVIDASDLDGVVGEVGLSGFGDRHNGALIGYWLLPHARGFGLAGRGVKAVTTWAHDALDLALIVARCHDSNPASQRVAAAAGYIFERSDSTGHQLWVSRSTH